MSYPPVELASDDRSGRRSVALVVVLVLWLVYTVLQTLAALERISEPLYAIIGFLPGILAVMVLLPAGLSREDCGLKIAPLSWKGFAVLAAVFVFALATMLPFGQWRGWNWTAALIYAPAGSIAQELFFRSALLPAILAALKKWPILGLVAHSLLFSLWHIGPLFMGTPLPLVAAIMFVPFLSGLGWGWEVKRDRTVIWAMIQHSLIWVVASPFTFGA